MWERAGKPAWTTELERAANEAARPAAMVGNFLARKLRDELVSAFSKESTDLKIKRGLSLIGCSHFVCNDEYKPRTVRHCVLALLALCWFGNHDIKRLARFNYYQHLSSDARRDDLGAHRAGAAGELVFADARGLLRLGATYGAATR